MEVMGGKWKSCIIQELSLGAKRPSELHRLFEEASPRVINQQLKELEMHGIVKKKIFSELPPHSEYSITETGKKTPRSDPPFRPGKYNKTQTYSDT